MIGVLMHRGITAAAVGVMLMSLIRSVPSSNFPAIAAYSAALALMADAPGLFLLR